jgi:hypothetical protein
VLSKSYTKKQRLSSWPALELDSSEKAATASKLHWHMRDHICLDRLIFWNRHSDLKITEGLMAGCIGLIAARYPSMLRASDRHRVQEIACGSARY